MLDKKKVLSCIKNDEEKLIVSKAIDQLERALRYHEPTFTDFIPITNIKTVLDTLRFSRDVNIYDFGGNCDCERRMIGFSPEYMSLENKDFPISAVKINLNKKFSSEINHRDYLGSILGLGIDRGKIGDIVIYDSGAICYCKSEISEYIAVNLQRVRRNTVKTEISSIEELILPEKSIVDKAITVSSLRFDVIICAAFNISRSKAQALIEGEKAFINWNISSNTSYQIKEKDTISLRGYGRIIIQEIRGKTKKNRISIVIGKYV